MNKVYNLYECKIFMNGVEISAGESFVGYVTYSSKPKAAVSRMKGLKNGIAVVKGNRKALKQDTSWG